MGTIVYDNQISFRNGQNYNDTDGVTGNTYLQGVNVRPYGDDLVPRYPYEYKQVNIPSGTKESLSLEQIFSKGNPQALIPFIDGDSSFLIVIINGTWFRISTLTYDATVINYDKQTSKLSSSIQAVNWVVIDRAIVVFDGDLPLLYYGETIRRANIDATYTFIDTEGNRVVVPVPEAIRSSIGTYDNLRLWIGIGSNVLAASDEVGSGPPNAPLSFSQSFTDAGEYTGQFPTLSNSTTFERITAMGTFISQNPTFTGKLFVATKNKFYTIASQELRANWDKTPGFITQLLDVGIVGSKAWSNFGYDLLFTDNKGRTNSLYLSQENLERWSETTISTEVSNYINTVDTDLYQYTSLVNFGSLALQTVYPYYTTRYLENSKNVLSFAFKGFLALSKENMSGLNQQATPVWAGLWEGINPIFTAKIDDKLYILADDNGVNSLYVCEEKIANDLYSTEEKAIRSRITLGHYYFQNTVIQDKIFKSLDFSIADINSDLIAYAEYKPSTWTKWLRIGGVHTKKESCFACHKHDIISDRSGVLRNYSVQPPEENSIQRFRSADIRLTLQGLWRLCDFRLKAEALPDSSTLELNDSPVYSVDNCSEIGDYDIYRTFNSSKNTVFEETYLKCLDNDS